MAKIQACPQFIYSQAQLRELNHGSAKRTEWGETGSHQQEPLSMLRGQLCRQQPCEHLLFLRKEDKETRQGHHPSGFG